MNIKILKYFLIFFILIISKIFIAPKANKIEDESKKEITAILQGYFTGDIEGNIEKMILYDDFTFAADLKTSDIHAAFSGSYTLDEKNFFSFEGYGEALGPEQDVDISVSKFSIFGKGVLDLHRGSGNGELVFIFDDWNEKDNDDYYLFINNPGN